MLTRTIVFFSMGVAAVLFGAGQIEAQPGKGGKGSGGKGPGAGGAPDISKLESDLEKLLEQVQATKAALARAKEAQGGKKKGGFDGQKGNQDEGQKGKKGGFEGQKGNQDEGQKGKKGGFKGQKGNQDEGQKGKKGGFEGKGKGKDGEFKKREDFKKEFGKGGFPPFGKGPFGGKGFEGKGPKLDPETIKEKYEFYKKLYDELPRDTKKGKGYEGWKGKGYEGWKGRGYEGWKGRFGPKGETKKSEPPTPPTGKGKGSKGPGATPATPSRSVESRIDALIRELEALRSEVKGSKKK